MFSDNIKTDYKKKYYLVRYYITNRLRTRARFLKGILGLLTTTRYEPTTELCAIIIYNFTSSF